MGLKDRMMRKSGLVLLLLCIATALLAVSGTATPVFITPTSGQTFILTEDVNFQYNISASDPGFYPINFTDTSHDPQIGFDCFSKSALNGSVSLIGFTPTNDYVGYYTLNIIATNSIGEIAAITVHFNVTNSNDAPTITDTEPADGSHVAENSTLTLSVTAADIDIVHGDNLSFAWYLDNATDSKLVGAKISPTYSNATYSPLIEDFDSGPHNITVIVSDSAGAQVNYTWHIIVDNTNRPPVFNQTFQNMTWDEDNDRLDNLTLSDHFYDPDTNGTLCELDTGFCLQFGYDLTGGNESGVMITINSTTTNVSFHPSSDWIGTINVSFWVYDGYVKVYGNNITINITNINDAPVLSNISDQTTYANTDFQYLVNATDVEDDPITYSISSLSLSSISINNTTGLISLSSNSTDVGNHTVNVTVSDGMDNASISFSLEVLPNSRPQIIPFVDQTVQQYNILTIIINATDADGYSGNNLTLWTNFTAFNPGQRYNESAWNFTVNPTNQSMVGNHSVRVYVNDSHDSMNHYDFVLEITDLAMPPIIENVSVPNDQIKVNVMVEINVSAFDEDGNIIGFSDNTTLFDIANISNGNTVDDALGTISFTPGSIGYHVINISVRDSTGYVDWTELILDITPNHDPYFALITNITCEEHETCTHQIIAEDFDWQDTLILGDNATDFDISQSGHISFIPPSQEAYFVEIWVSDGTVNVTAEILVNITEIDDPPYFMDNVSLLSAWDNVVENSTTLIQIDAADEEYNLTGDMLTLTVDFINFTDLNGTTYIGGISLFDYYSIIVNADNTTSGFISFTPNSSQVGTYWVNFSVSDNNSVTSEIFEFTIQNINNLPVFNWTLGYLNTSMSGSHTDTENQLNCTENQTLSINVTAFDIDYDALRYIWTAINSDGTSTLIDNSTYNMTTASLEYTIPFDAYPNQTIVLTVVDAAAQRNISWILFADNVNRNVTFGTAYYELNTSGESYNHTEIVNGSLVVEHNGSLYYPVSSFVSGTIDFHTTSLDILRIDYQNITYTNNDNNSGAYEIIVYTDTTNLLFDDTYEIMNGSIQSLDLRYMQFMLGINSTNTSFAPEIDDIRIYYNIHDLSVSEDSEYAAWLDLDNFFDDPDDDDTIVYGYRIIEGANLINVSIVQDHYVRIQFVEGGTAQLVFNATDQWGSYAESNLINIEISSTGESPVPTVTPTSSSSRTRTQIQIEYQYQKEEEPVALDIIHPERVDIYENETMLIPVVLQNSDQFELRGLKIDAYTDREGLDVNLDKNYISVLPRGASDTVTLSIYMDKVYESYNVFVTVNVTDPEYSDSAKILITSLKKMREGEEEQELKLAFVSDLLSKNEDCAELSEYITRAKDYFENGEDQKGYELLDQFVNDCKLLIKGNQQQVDQPQSIIELIIGEITKSRENLIITITLGLLFLITVVILLVVIYRKI